MSLDDIAPLTSVVTSNDAVNISSVSTCDVDEQAAMISDWAEHYQQISPGLFTGNLHQVQFGKTQVFSETVSQHDSGEDYLYPAKLFEPVDIREIAAERLHSIFNA